MSNSLIPLDQIHSHLPSKMVQQRQAVGSANRNFAEGIRDAFPTMSIKGKVFTFRHLGAEQVALDANNFPANYLDVVLVSGSPFVAKTYYKSGYVEGDLNPPDCWSADSIKPDASVMEKQNPTCLDCPKNRFGSRMAGGQTGDRPTQAKACQDQRRIAIAMPHHLGQPEALPVLLRVPTMSLRGLKDYAQQLDRYGVEVNAVITRLSFDRDEAYPKLVFQYAGVLDEPQYDSVLGLAEGETVFAMLSAPISEPASDNLDPTQTVVQQGYASAPPAPPPRPAPAQNVTPLRPHVQPHVQPQPAQEPVQPQPAPTPQPQPSPPPAAAAAPLPGLVGGLMHLPDGRWYNPITQQFCDEQGQPVGATGSAAPEPQVAQAPAPQPQAQHGGDLGPRAVPTWTPPQAQPAQQAQPAAQAQPAQKPKRTRPGPMAKPNGTQEVAAAGPGLENLLSTLMPPSGGR